MPLSTTPPFLQLVDHDQHFRDRDISLGRVGLADVHFLGEGTRERDVLHLHDVVLLGQFLDALRDIVVALATTIGANIRMRSWRRATATSA